MVLNSKREFGNFSKTGKKYSTEVNPSFGLTEEDVERIIKESLKQSEADVETRVCEEKKLELSRNLDALMVALEKDAALLEDKELEKILKVMDDAKIVLKDSEKTKQDIEKVVSELNSLAEPFAKKRMNEAIGSVLKGQNVDGLS